MLSIDLIVLGCFVLPGLFGYIGSEGYEWTGLAVAVIGIPTGVLLFIILGILHFIEKRKSIVKPVAADGETD